MTEQSTHDEHEHEHDHTHEHEHDVPVDENEVAPPAGTPDALANPDLDAIQAAAEPREDDPYQLRSGVPLGGGDATDPASQMNR